MVLPAYLEGVAQELHVVKAQGADPAHDRAADAVGGVQPAAEAHLQDHHVHLLLQENFEACGTGHTTIH